MRIALMLVAIAPLFGGDFETFTDNSLNYTQRTEGCLGLRGNRAPEVLDAMRAALENSHLQGCAGVNLRLAGAAALLLDAAVKSADPGARAVAVRELGTMQKAEYLPVLRKAAEDAELIVASNAVEGLVRYENHASAPELREIALMGGVMTALALGDLLVGIRVVGLMGDASDLPKLRELGKNDMAMGSGSRGFGVMPAISLARAAKTAVEAIEKRAGR
ncbi:MAG: HEAT repeat domain-containing protein [Acidobacteriia bacterium]|nr:HEAT repeat domain-containing protein [Terriglobia bacterium]